MISIIICSINPGYLHQLKENILSTINVAYELLVWDNRGKNIGICEVYNNMAGKAKFDYICFIHEDILFDTFGWGMKICNTFTAANDIGLIGLAGSRYKSKTLSGWYTGIDQLDCVNIMHRYPDRDEHLYLKPPATDQLVKVVCLDGVFLCCRKSVWQSLKFDQDNLTGFHFYDIDFSLRASAICTVVVTYHLLITHITVGGDFGKKWMKDAFLFHNLKDDLLPVSVIAEDAKVKHEKIVKTWLDVLKNQKIPILNRWEWIWKQGLLKSPKYYYAILKFLLYKPLGLKYLHKQLIRK